MRALRWQKQEPGLAEERRNLVQRYMGDETPASPSATEELPADEAGEEVSLPATAGTDVVVNDVEPPPVSSSEPRADVDVVDTPRAVEPEPPAPPIAVPDLLEPLGREVDTPPAVEPEPSAPPIAAPDLLETLRPAAFGGALRTLEEVGRLCEQLVRLGEEHGRWNALLAEKERQVVPPPGSHGP